MKIKMAVKTLLLVVVASWTAVVGAENDRHMNAYIGVGGHMTSLENRTTGLATAKFAFTINDKWALGLLGAAFLHDRTLDELVDDGTYHFFASYGGMFIERTFTLTNRFDFSLAIMTGQGQASYEYDNEYRQEKVWTEETIDRTTFGVQELSAQVSYRVTERFQIGVNASYRHTSPLYLIGTDENMLKAPNVGLNLSYSLF